MNRRPLFAAVAAALLSFAARAETELVVWHAYRAAEKAAFEKVAAAFNASHPGVKVATLAVPYDAFADKISAAVPRGKGPDVFIYAQDRLGGWIEAGNTVEPIDFYLDQATKDRFLPRTLDAMNYRGTVYGLPVDYKVITLIYNKKLVPVPPKTSAELVTVAKKLTDKAAGRFGLAYAYNDFYYHAALMNGFGGRVFEGSSAKPVLNTPENVRGIEQLMTWFDKDQILPAEPSSALIIALFNEGKAAMVFSGPWFLGEVDRKIDWGLAPLPTLVENGDKPMRPWMTVEGAFIAAPSKHKEAAYDFVKFLTDKEQAKVLALEGRQSPANKAVYEDAKIAADPVLKAFRAQAEVALPMPNLPEMAMVWSPVTTMMGAVTHHSIAAKPALEGAQAQVLKDVSALRKK
jgi:arabinogalactan oligomer/maltooligosaccharide transport system substrate-binding protein